VGQSLTQPRRAQTNHDLIVRPGVLTSPITRKTGVEEYAHMSLAPVYAGAHRFGVEILDAGPRAPLLAAKLAADTFAPSSRGDDHPKSIFSSDAGHGGL
jgi:hypothetical protein